MLEKATRYNRETIALALSTFGKILDLKEYKNGVCKTSPDGMILKTASKIQGAEIKTWSIMKSTEMSYLAEADPKALRHLSRTLYHFYGGKNNFTY